MVVAVDFRLLGAVEVCVDGRPIEIGHARQRGVLAALLVDANRPVPADELLDRVWADQLPLRARNALSGYMSRLRQVVAATGQATITRGPAGYLLTVDRMAVDLHRFRGLVVRARAAAGDEQAEDLFDRALRQWRDGAFRTLDTPWFNALRAVVEMERFAAELDRNDLALRRGRHAEILAGLRARAAEYPLDERLAGQLLLALYRSGRQGAALEYYEQIRLRLADELGADLSPPLRELHRRILVADAALATPASGCAAPQGGSGEPHGGLPVPLTSFVGRCGELREIEALLSAHRLVTLTGAGGVGKSRLALEAARRCLAGPGGGAWGAWLVELAAVDQPELVVDAVAAAVGVPDHRQRLRLDLLVERLATVEALLLLDNCEHLVVEVARVAERLLRSCPHLRILATSRERLSITGEVVWVVAGLGVPPAGATDPETVRRAEAVQLLADRVAAVQPGFTLSGTTAAAAGQICQRLDGLPLAIELAAARASALSIEQITARLDDRFHLLSHGSRTAMPRHQTLRAVVDWSYEQLTGAEQRLFDRLAVFVGGFTVQAAEAVCADLAAADATVVDLVTSLVDKSLVTVNDLRSAAPRYLVLETLRAYGLARLASCGLAADLRYRHAAYVVAMVESAAPGLRGPAQAHWLQRLEAEHGNIRAALEWSISQGDATTAMRLAGGLYLLWDRHGHYREASRWLDRVLTTPADVPAAVRARALNTAAGLAVVQGELARAQEASEAAAALGRQAGDRAEVAQALQHLGLAAVYADDLVRATAVLTESLDHARQAGDRWLEGFALLFLIVAALAGDDPAQAVRWGSECVTVLRPVGDQEGLGWMQVLRGVAAWRAGQLGEAADLLRDGLGTFQAVNHPWGLSVGVWLAGQLAGARQDHERATYLLGASEAMRLTVGAALPRFVREWLHDALGRARHVLGTVAYDRAWYTGQSVPGDRAVADARYTGIEKPAHRAPRCR